MVDSSQFCVSWGSYKSSLFNGFSALQKNGELVDMTLAADGHFVKVHQVLIALASPYLKDLIASAPCQHPVIFLNNVSHQVLCLLMEYIYTGEVEVPVDKLNAFVESAKALHIIGIDDLKRDESLPQTKNVSNNQISEASIVKNEVINSAKTDDNFNNASRSHPKESNRQDEMEPENMDTSEYLDDSNSEDDSDKNNKQMKEFLDKSSQKLHYAVSNRGTLQLILNRYIYTLHYVKQRSGLHRWRCIQNRDSLCRAVVDTKGPLVVSRVQIHNHPFHDIQILKKVKKNSVFASVEEVENALKAHKESQ